MKGVVVSFVFHLLLAAGGIASVSTLWYLCKVPTSSMITIIVLITAQVSSFLLSALASYSSIVSKISTFDKRKESGLRKVTLLNVISGLISFVGGGIVALTIRYAPTFTDSVICIFVIPAVVISTIESTIIMDLDPDHGWNFQEDSDSVQFIGGDNEVQG